MVIGFCLFVCSVISLIFWIFNICMWQRLPVWKFIFSLSLTRTRDYCEWSSQPLPTDRKCSQRTFTKFWNNLPVRVHPHIFAKNVVLFVVKAYLFARQTVAVVVVVSSDISRTTFQMVMPHNICSKLYHILYEQSNRK